MKTSVFKTLLFGLSLISGFYGCRKDQEELDTTLGYEVGQFESMTNDVDNMVGQVWQGDGSISQKISAPTIGSLLSGCATVNHDTVNNTIIIDFGTGCVGSDGRTRAGKVDIQYTGNYFTPGSSHTITFDSFYVDTRHIEGVRQVTNNGLNNAGNMNWTVVATNMKITRTDGYWRSWNSTRTREMTQGFGDLLWSNDVYRVNGTANGSNSNGNTFSMTITDVIRNNSCHWITSGVVVISPTGFADRVLDFGGGACDDQATVTVGNRSRTITLR